MKKTSLALAALLISNSTWAIENGTRVNWNNDFDDIVNNNCTGLIVGQNQVITAAHCLITDHIQLSSGKFISASSRVVHPRYDNKNYDIAIWTLPELAASKNIRFFANVTSPQNLVSDRVHAFGFGGNNPLAYAELEVVGSADKSSTLISANDIGLGASVSGDSGGVWLNTEKEIISIHRGWVAGADYRYSTSTDLYYARDFLLDQVNGWHYQGLANTTNSKVTVTVQSLHKNAVTDTAYTSGDAQIVGGTCQGKSVINAFETCTYDIESQGSEGKLFLTSDEFVTINKAKNSVKPDNGNGGGDSGSSGGSFGFLSLLALGLMSVRKKR